MESHKPVTVRRPAAMCAVSLLAAIGGAVAARLLGRLLPASPAWLGPAIIIGSLGLLLVGLLLLAVAIRHRRGTASRAV
jgi:hypothetical protein